MAISHLQKFFLKNDEINSVPLFSLLVRAFMYEAISNSSVIITELL